MAVASRTRPAPLSPVPPAFYPLPDRNVGSGSRPSSGRVVSPAPSAAVTALLLTAITTVAAFLRLWHGAAQSLRIDESFSMRWAAWPLTPIYHGKELYAQSLFQATASDVHPPGYLLLLHFWMQSFGTDLALLRLPSEIAGLLAVPALYLLGASLYGRTVGLFAALLGAFSPLWIWHTQEVRMYPFLLLFCIVSTYGLVQALEQRRWWGWPILFAGSVLAIYAQYFAFFVLFAQALFVALHWRQYIWGRLVAWLGTMVLVALAFLPWALIVLHTKSGGSDPSLQKPDLYTPLSILIGFLFGYLTTPLTSQLLAAWPLLVMTALGLSIFAGATPRRGSLVWLLFLTPVVLAFVVSFAVRPFIAERYLIVCTPPLYIMLAVVFARLRGRLPRFAIATLSVVTLLFALNIQETNAANPNLEDYRSVVSYLNTHVRPGDAVALDSFFNQDAYSYYSHINLPTYPLPPVTATRGAPMTPRELGAYLGGIESGYKRLWVVYYLEGNYDTKNAIPNYLASHTAGHVAIYGGPGKRNDPHHVQSYRNVQLVLYTIVGQGAATEWVHPQTIQEVRALTHITPTLREPYASPFGRPGGQTPLIGPLIAPPPLAQRWRFAALPRSARDVRLTLFNANSTPITASIHTIGHKGMHQWQVSIPGSSNLELKLSKWGGGDPNAALDVRTGDALIPQRAFTERGTRQFQYGLLGSGQKQRQRGGTTPLGLGLWVDTHAAGPGAGDTARIAISYAPNALVRVTVTVPGQSPDSFYDTTDDHGRLTLAVPAPRGLAQGHGRVMARVVVQGNAAQGGLSVSRTLVVANGR
jgi:4-amino-4-deoxy-L-arabinose transferase-like glycosyltransferase